MLLLSLFTLINNTINTFIHCIVGSLLFRMEMLKQGRRPTCLLSLFEFSEKVNERVFGSKDPRNQGAAQVLPQSGG